MPMCNDYVQCLCAMPMCNAYVQRLYAMPMCIPMCNSYVKCLCVMPMCNARFDYRQTKGDQIGRNSVLITDERTDRRREKCTC